MALSAGGRTLVGVKYLLAVVVALGLLVASPASAQVRPVNEGGDYRPCVAYDEFLAFHVGMPEHKVQRVFDTKGRRETRKGHLDAVLEQFGIPGVRKHSIIRSYPRCDRADRVLVEFSTRTGKHRAQSGILGF